MDKSLANRLEELINLLTIILAFALPLFFLPVTSEFFEFNKQILLIGGSVVLFTIWSLKTLINSKVVIRQTPLNLPLLIFLIGVALATVLSADKFVSIAGPYPKFGSSFLVTLSSILIFFITATNCTKPNQITRILIALFISTSIAALLSVLNYFNIVVFQTSWGKVPSFTPLGNFENLAFLELIVIPLGVGLALQAKSYQTRIVSLVGIILILASLIFINIISIWVVLGILSVLFFLRADKLKIDRKGQTLLIFICAIFAILVIVANFKPISSKILAPLANQKEMVQLPKEKQLPASVGWTVATGVLGSSPVKAIFGLGPGTFQYAYTQFKPPTVNKTDLWDIRFIKSSSDILEFLATIGILGTGLYLIFFGLATKFFLNQLSGERGRLEPINFFLILSILGFIAGSFLLTASIPIYFAFYLILGAVLNSLAETNHDKIFDIQLDIVALKSGGFRLTPIQHSLHQQPKWQINLLATGLSIFSLVVSSVIGFGITRAYQAEIANFKAIDLVNKGQDLKFVREAAVTAILANPFRDIYHRNLALIDLEIAKNLSQRQNLTDEEKTAISQVIQEAIVQGKIITGYQNPPMAGQSGLNVVNWETLALIYANLVGEIKDFNNHAINTATKVASLDKFNPRAWLSLGQIQQRTGDLDNAIRSFETAINLKPDFAPVHYNLAQVLKTKGGADQRVLSELGIVLEILPKNDPDYSKIQKEYDDLKATLPSKEQSQDQPVSSPSQATPSAY